MSHPIAVDHEGFRCGKPPMKNQITSIYYYIVIEMRGGGKSFIYIPKSSSLLACLDEIPRRMTMGINERSRQKL